MSTHALPIDEQALAQQLAATPGLDLGPNGHLVPLPSSPDLRAPRALRHHFEWICADTPRFHLVAGPQAAADFEQTKLFHSHYPDLSIRPFALIQLPDNSPVAVLEHFNGRSLESVVASHDISTSDALSLLDRLIDRLDASAVPAQPGELSEELDLLREELVSSPVWGALDLHFFDSTVFPFLRNALASTPLMRRWTNGDFIPRNILINANREIRLIDFEFASQSSLSAADYFRFGEFSTLPPEIYDHVRCRLPGDPRVWRIHFCLDQARKLARIRTPESFAFDAEPLLLRLLREFAPHSASPTCLARSRNDYDSLAQHAHDLKARYDDLHAHAANVQKQYDDLSLHSRELQNRYDDLLAQYNSLLARYDDLLAHSNSLQGHYDALAQHARILQAVCDARAQPPQ